MTFMIAEVIPYFSLQTILNRVTRILKCFSRCKFLIYLQLGFSTENSKIQLGKKNKRLPSFEDRSVQRDELELVMGKLGIFCHPKGEKLPESLSSEDMFNMFEKEQPRSDEVMEAFDVFDENKDGFIDARELQRVLSALGWKDRADMDDCKQMIGVFDENADGRIDFHEFVKFMEGTFC